jgi:tripartite-type tricarboxylate transporter receptor subunit TctC
MGVFTSVLLLSAAACGGEASGPASDNSPGTGPVAGGMDLEEHFDGQKIDFVVGFSAGGGYDLIARLMAPYLEEELPGNPQVVVQNVPGGGGLAGVQEVLRAPADGLTMGMMPLGRFYIPELLGYDIENFEAEDVAPLGRPLGGSVFVGCVRNNVATSWEEILRLGEQGNPVKFPATDTLGGIEGDLDFLVAAGAPIKIVRGYNGTSEMAAAFVRGETDGYARCSETSQFSDLADDVVQDPGVTALWWKELKPDQEWLDYLGADSMPLEITELPGIDPSESLVEAFNLSTVYSGGRATFMRSGAPEEVEQAWRNAVEAVSKNPDYQEGLRDQDLNPGYADPQPFIDAAEVLGDLDDETRDYLVGFLGLEGK